MLHEMDIYSILRNGFCQPFIYTCRSAYLRTASYFYNFCSCEKLKIYMKSSQLFIAHSLVYSDSTHLFYFLFRSQSQPYWSPPPIPGNPQWTANLSIHLFVSPQSMLIPFSPLILTIPAISTNNLTFSCQKFHLMFQKFHLLLGFCPKNFYLWCA